MLLETLKSNRTVNFILFPLAGVLLWWKNFVFPHSYPFYNGETDNLLYSPIHKLAGEFPLLQNLLALLLLILLAFIILQINNRYNFIRVRTMLPAPLFIIMVSGFTGMHTLHPVYFGAVFLLVAIFRLFSTFDQIKPYSAAFDSGFFLGIASLFYFNLFILFPAILLGIGILSRETRWREFIIATTGFLLPFVFAFGYAFFSDRMLELLKTFELNIISPNNYFKPNLPMQIYAGYLALLTFLGSIKVIQQYDTKKVSTRRFLMVFFWLFVCSVFSFIFVPATSQEMLVISTIPVTFLTANFFVFLKSRFWRELLFAILLLIVVALQFLS